MFEQNLIKRQNPLKLLPGIKILDNTLRDGEQTPGISFSYQDKLDILKALCECGVKEVEVGFPASAESERTAIKNLVSHDLPANLHGLCRLSKEDIDYASQCGLKNITLFLPGSKRYIEQNLKLNLNQLTETIKSMVSYATEKNISVKFSCENASRMDLETLINYYQAAISAGASTISFPDTSGVMTPFDTYRCVKILKQELQANISIHCHNDLGLATANTLAAAEAGAIELQVCVNGLGERAGNAALEEVVLALVSQYNYNLGIDLTKLHLLSELVYERSGLCASFNKPIFGQNVFRHESAIHATSILRGENLYEPFSPSLVGRSHEIILGKHCGLPSLEYYLTQVMNIKLSYDDTKKLLSYIKEHSEQKELIDLNKFIKKLGLSVLNAEAVC
ncbi:MAG TPA: 2-isopropylmalate synthase [Gammaproteobacteria bacterium]|nr:2-isopropylmalate synthase [Gammaproteobacteria bacterium]